MLNRTISMLTTVSLVAAVVWFFQLTEPTSLLIIGAAAAALQTCFGLTALHRRRMGISTGLTAEDTPLSAFVLGLKRAALLLLVIAVALAASWAGGVWQPVAAEHGTKQPATSVEPHLTNTGSHAATTPSVTIQGTVEQSELHAPFQYLTVTFRDEEGRLIEGLNKEQITLRVGSLAVAVVEAAPVVWHRPLYWLILRDASNSVQRPPFPTLIERTSTVLVRQAFAAGFPVAFRVVDFSSASQEVSPWSRTERDVRTTFDAAAVQSSHSAVFNAAADGMQDLANCHGERRLTLITDLGDNVGSTYSLEGLVAQATSTGVVLDVVTLPTEHFTDRQQAAAKQLVTKPGGQVIDAASPALDAAIGNLVRSSARPLAAYRIIWKGDGQTKHLQVTATMGTGPETTSGSGQVAARRSETELILPTTKGVHR